MTTVPEKDNFKEQGFDLAHGFRVFKSPWRDSISDQLISGKWQHVAQTVHIAEQESRERGRNQGQVPPPEAPAALTGDLGLVPSTQMVWFITTSTRVPGDLTPSLTSGGHCTHMVHIQAKHSYT